jgi:hypothetical protein
MPAVGKRFLISFKVRLADVITVANWDSTHGRRISQKHLDFVLTTATARIIAVVELNDASHQKVDRQQRDEFVADALRAARIPFVTFPIYGKYNEQRIRNRILASIAACRAYTESNRAAIRTERVGARPRRFFRPNLRGRNPDPSRSGGPRRSTQREQTIQPAKASASGQNDP